MPVKMMAVAFAAIGLSAWVATAAAQHEQHQMPGTAGPGNASVGACADNAKAVSGVLDQLNARVEDARQFNDPAKLRAAVGDLQIVLTRMKAQLADCIALAGAGMPNMSAMDHSRMQMLPGTPVMQPGSPSPAPAAPAAGTDHLKMHGEKAPAAGTTPAKAEQAPTVHFALRTQPAPPRHGNNDFEVTLKDAAGKPIADAEVSVEFSMPAMPSMKMVEARLTSSGNGSYKGTATMDMAGDWDVTIKASPSGQPVVVKRMRLTVK